MLHIALCNLSIGAEYSDRVFSSSRSVRTGEETVSDPVGDDLVVNCCWTWDVLGWWMFGSRRQQGTRSQISSILVLFFCSMTISSVLGAGLLLGGICLHFSGQVFNIVYLFISIQAMGFDLKHACVVLEKRLEKMRGRITSLRYRT
jgi:hypothetical protein